MLIHNNCDNSINGLKPGGARCSAATTWSSKILKLVSWSKFYLRYVDVNIL